MRTRHRAVVLGTAGVIVGSSGAALAPTVEHHAPTPKTVTVAPAAVVRTQAPEAASRDDFRVLLPTPKPTSHVVVRRRTAHRVVVPRRTTTPAPTRTAVVVTGGQALDVTAYCDTAGTPNSLGRTPRVGDVAVLPGEFPLGSRVEIYGVGTYEVADHIGHGSQVDIYYGSDAGCEQRALDWGRHRLHVAPVTG